MKYQSTRGGNKGSSFEDALFSGYASDGGIYVPESFPTFPLEIRAKWQKSPPKYQEVGTSGDTGSAAIEAVKGLQGIDIIVLYPKGKITQVQELQMITVPDRNVHVFQVEGTNDELDVPIKQSFPAPGLLSINSINWARIMIQVAHHIYLCTLEHCQPVDIYVPTGAAGNLVSGLVASLLGFPVNLFCAQNTNDNVEILVNKGVLGFGGEISNTFSSAMDIRNPYNVERLLYFLSDSKTTKNIMDTCESSLEPISVPIPELLQKKLTNIVKGAMKVDTPTTLKMIKECWNANKYLICPHTATAVAYFQETKRRSPRTENKVYVIATASPEKFAEATAAANITEDAAIKTGNIFLQLLTERPRKQPKLMGKGKDWLNILQNEITLIRQSTT